VRSKVLELQERLSQAEEAVHDSDARHDADTASLHEELLRLRDEVIGKEAELGTALGRVAELESYVHRYEGVTAHYEAVLQSRSWRLARLLTAPVRKLKGSG
jgi:hypothetical protein